LLSLQTEEGPSPAEPEHIDSLPTVNIEQDTVGAFDLCYKNTSTFVDNLAECSVDKHIGQLQGRIQDFAKGGPVPTVPFPPLFLSLSPLPPVSCPLEVYRAP